MGFSKKNQCWQDFVAYITKNTYTVIISISKQSDLLDIDDNTKMQNVQDYVQIGTE